MKPSDVKKAFEKLAAILHQDARVVPKRMDTSEYINSMMEGIGYAMDCHLLWMCVEGQKMIDDHGEMLKKAEAGARDANSFDILSENLLGAQSKLEKSMRWLGFVQGVLWRSGACSIDELKTMNSEGT